MLQMKQRPVETATQSGQGWLITQPVFGCYSLGYMQNWQSESCLTRLIAPGEK